MIEGLRRRCCVYESDCVRCGCCRRCNNPGVRPASAPGSEFEGALIDAVREVVRAFEVLGADGVREAARGDVRFEGADAASLREVGTAIKHGVEERDQLDFNDWRKR